jgi:acyl-CoA thioester hydrolase
MTSENGEGHAARGDFAFFHPLRVRWAEVDPQGIVFNPRYFMYFDQGLTEYLRAIGFPYPAGLKALGSDLFAVSAQANFRASAVYDDELDIAVRVARIGRTSLTFAMAIFRGEELLVAGTMIYVNTDLATKAPAALPDALISKILAFERTPPERKV